MNGTFFFGGAFDPLTLAHEAILRTLRRNSGATVIVCVTDHEYKNPPMFPYEVRFGMVNLFMEHLAMRYDGIWDVVPQRQRTWDFLHTENFKFPVDDSPVIVLGMDEMKDLMAGKWQHSLELLSTYMFLVLPRTGSDISSTQVRRLLQQGAPDDELLKYVSPQVLAAIRAWQKETS